MKPKKRAKPKRTNRTPLRARAAIPRADGKAGKDNDVSWWPKFLAALVECPNVRAACLAANVSWNTAYLHRAKFPEFAEQWLEAEAQGNETLRGEAFRRAVHGVEEPVYQGGDQVGTVRKYSDSVLMFLMKSHMPKVYGDKSKIDHTHQVLTDEEVAQRGAEAEQGILATLAAKGTQP